MKLANSQNLQNFCWNWFEQSGNPKAYMEYIKTKSTPANKHENI